MSTDKKPDVELNEQFPDARRFLSKGDGEADRETIVGPSSGFLDGWGKLCEGCKQPVNYPTNRYMDSMFCLGDRVWHSRCVPAGGVSGTFTISGNGGGGQQVETPASRERTAAPTTDDAPKMARPFHTRYNAERLLSFREAHCQGDHDEAWHQIYSMVAENCADPYNPWTELEKLSPTPDVPPEGHRP